MLRIPHCLDSRLTDGGKVVRPKHRLRSIPQKHYFSAFDSHFCYRLSESQGLVRPQGLGKLRNFIHLIGSRTSDLPACSLVPQPLRYRVFRRYELVEHQTVDVKEFRELFDCPSYKVAGYN
jgi:hypothetical protein